MVKDAQDEQRKQAYLDRAAEITEAHIAPVEYTEPTDGEIDAYYAKREADKTAAMNARKLSEDEMIAIGREFVISNWKLNEEQTGRLELYTNSDPEVPVPDRARAGSPRQRMVRDGERKALLQGGIPALPAPHRRAGSER